MQGLGDERGEGEGGKMDGEKGGGGGCRRRGYGMPGASKIGAESKAGGVKSWG